MKKLSRQLAKSARNFSRARLMPLALRLGAPLVWARRRLRPHRANFEILSGKVRGGEGSLTVLSGLQNQFRQHVLNLIFEAIPAGQPAGEKKIYQVFCNVRAAAPAADLALVPATEGQHAWMDDGTWFSIPDWINSQVAVPLPENVLRHDTVRAAIRLRRRYGYEYVLTHDEKQFEEFYYRMHAPLVQKTYGDRGHLDPFAVKRAGLGEFDLLLLQKKSAPGEYLSGLVVLHQEDAPRLWAFGVRDGDRQLVREGAISALYLFSFEHYAALGHRKIYMGGTRPFLHDGVLILKRRYSHQIINTRWPGCGLKILRLTPAVKTFLIENPFIFRSHGKIYGAIFLPAMPAAGQIAELHHQFHHHGLERLIFWGFDAGDSPAPPVPPELASQVEFRPAAALVSENLHLP